MTIGEKLKAARGAAGFTQEQVAERLRVSRQTVSSWENDRSYPDIAGTIALAELYRLSLDELLKEDQAMLRHLTESTDLVKSRRTLSRRIFIAAYLVIWGVSIAFFWVAAGPTDAMAYGLIVLWLLLPVTTAVVSFFIGRDEEWQGVRWLMLLFFGVMYMLVPYATYSCANIAAFGTFHLPDLENMLPGVLSSAVGMGAGAVSGWLAEKRKEKEG